MRTLKISILFLLLIFTGCVHDESDPVGYVNPHIGNISHLLVPTYPTVHYPNSMLRFCPDRDSYTSNIMKGFPLNIISHRSEKIFSIIPVNGSHKESRADTPFTFDNEKITPYSYNVSLEEEDIDVRFVPGKKSGFLEFSFLRDSSYSVIIRTTGPGSLEYHDSRIKGYDTFSGVKTYLFMEFGISPSDVEKDEWSESGDNRDPENNRAGLRVSFANPVRHNLKVRYGISYISSEQARKNLSEDFSGWDLPEITEKAKLEWNRALSGIIVEGGTEDQRRVFYTSLYRCFERMINITEDGDYFSVWSNRKESSEDTTFYTDDWVWDTHLALHPLQCILNPGEQGKKITSYIRMARQSGWMPTFPTVTGDFHAMNGNHAAAVILDAWNKGIRNFSLGEAYKHLKNTIQSETRLPWVRDSAAWPDKFYDRKGWYPALRKGEPETCSIVHPFEKRQAVAVTLASSYDDWCMALIAKEIGKGEDYEFFSRRSLNYRNLFNSETGFYHPKDSLGIWIEPFDYRFDGGLGARDYYDENNGWTYIWQPLHALDDLIEMMGGRDKFDTKLDQLFTEDIGRSKWQYYATMPDATGNVGQFVMGNEPSMHIAYLYNLAGKPWKTQKRVRMLMDTWFRDDLMGIPGDEDGGGLSAFYVFSAIGFYPVTPGIPEYQLGSPIFSKVTIKLQDNKSFTIIAKNNSGENKYIQWAELNGRMLSKPVLTHNDIMSGGRLVLKMGSKPNRNWCNR